MSAGISASGPGPEAGIGGMLSATQAGEFHRTFTAEREEILGSLSLAEASGSSSTNASTSTSTELGEISQKILALRNAVNAIAGQLPLYDRGRYEKQITELETKSSTLKAKGRPKSKFSFSKPKTKVKPDLGLDNTSKLDPILSGNLTITSDISPTPSAGAGTILSSNPSSSSSSTYTISSLSHTLVRPPLLPPDTRTYTLSLSDISDCLIDLRPYASSTTNFDCSTHLSPGRLTQESAHAAGPLNTTQTGSPGIRGTLPTPTLTAIHAKGLKRCVLLAPIVGSSALLDQVEDSLIVVGAQQFRIHSSTNTTVLLHVASLPVIEHSEGMRFGSYPYEHMLVQPKGSIISEGMSSVQSDAVLRNDRTDMTQGQVQIHRDQSQSKHNQVQDFDWVRGGQSPHWRLLSETESASIFRSLQESSPSIVLLSQSVAAAGGAEAGKEDVETLSDVGRILRTLLDSADPLDVSTPRE